jgi:uncharacterized protein
VLRKLAGEAARRAIERADSWLNVWTGLGTSRDMRTHTHVGVRAWLSDPELEELYTHNDMAGTIVDALPDEALRKPYTLHIEGDDGRDRAGVIEGRADELALRARVLEAWKWGRLYGGAAILIGADDGREMTEPLETEAIRSLEYLHVLTRAELIPDAWDGDPFSRTFGLPLIYRIQPHTAPGQSVQNALVHRSRLLVFDGLPIPARLRTRNQGWGASVLERPHEVLRDFGVSWAGAAVLLQDFSQAVWKVKGLFDQITSGDKETMRTRMELVEMTRSIVHAVVLDSDGEDFERKTTSIAGLPETLQLFILRLAGAARMPATVLMGQSPAGLNATGESDLRWWFNSIAAQQLHTLKPALETLYRLLLVLEGGEPEQWEIRFEPLWDETPTEHSNRRKTQADTDIAYITAGVLLPEEVAINRFRPTGWSQETSIDLDARREILQVEIERELEEAENPPPPPPALIPGQTPPGPGPAPQRAPAEPEPDEIEES